MRRNRYMRTIFRSAVYCGLFLALPLAAPLKAQPAQPASSGQAANAPAAFISLQEAIQRAKANEPNLTAAVAAAKSAAADSAIARSALLPGVIYHNQYLYTQSAHGPTQSGNASTSASGNQPIFIANNGVHEYISQAAVTETIGVQQIAQARQASAAAEAAAAQLEVARRGLVASVIQLYYGALSSTRRRQVAERALDEARHFTELTQNREAAREAAHADVVKAQLAEQQRTRELADAVNAETKAHLELAILLFPDPMTGYALDESPALAPLASFEDVSAAASKNNPDLKYALASLRASKLDVTAARAAYLPDLSLGVNYGIDAAQFAVNNQDGTHNLGYSAQATLDIPVWDWLATHNRVKQKEARRDAAQVALTAAQRHLIANIAEDYNEASTARAQLQSLEQSVDTARESLRLTRLRYEAGEATVFEVVDAQTSLVDTENTCEDGLMRYESALGNLQTLTGTL